MENLVTLLFLKIQIWGIYKNGSISQKHFTAISNGMFLYVPRVCIACFHQGNVKLKVLHHDNLGHVIDTFPNIFAHEGH
jgi:hypothetical protein